MSQLNCSGVLPFSTFSVLFNIVIFVLLLLVYKKSVGRFRRGVLFAFALVFFGGGWNIVERYFLDGCVRDYIPFFGLFYFNLQDILVVLGLGYLALNIVQLKKEDLP